MRRVPNLYPLAMRRLLKPSMVVMYSRLLRPKSDQELLRRLEKHYARTPAYPANLEHHRVNLIPEPSEYEGKRARARRAQEIANRLSRRSNV